MKKVIKHMNLLKIESGSTEAEYRYFEFVCRGCTMKNRGEIWEGFRVGNKCSKDNSYLFFVVEPGNAHDPNAVMVFCGGEFSGTTGYVGKEFALQVKEILAQCGEYRIDVLNEDEIGGSEISLVITWEDKEQTERRAQKREEERLRRKALGLPVTKRLRYMERQVNRQFVEKWVTEYEILENLQPSGTCLLLVTLEDGKQVRIYSGYFAEMQKPSFETDMAEEKSDE